ncbi:hypothetical protein QYF48_02665 [Brevibacillus agri]|uniref:hypothetical protein n=1 Tax=Brevibacillus agri TaxID=51101 RepID=UPI0025B6CAD7|nr:hypothetical protein [Brevibacillus agri]MDN4091727.1 hypothetical protein [Brevibacillus agri]
MFAFDDAPEGAPTYGQRWYDVTKEGWGPEEGLAIQTIFDAGALQNTLYVIAEAGTYKVKFQLIDVETDQVIAESDEVTITAE